MIVVIQNFSMEIPIFTTQNLSRRLPMKKIFTFISGDIVFIIASFLVVHYGVIPSTENLWLYYRYPFIAFVIIWVGSSLLFRKYTFHPSIERSIYRIAKSNLLTLMVLTMVIYFLAVDFSRLRLLGLVLITSFFEIVVTYLYLLNKRITEDVTKLERFYDEKAVVKRPVEEEEDEVAEFIDPQLRELVVEEIGEKAFTWCSTYLHHDYSRTLFISTTTRFNILNQPGQQYRNIVNLKQINQIRRINKFFEAVNQRMPKGGIFVDYVETYKLRKMRVLKKYPKGINWGVYTLDFIWKRVFPKMFFLRKIYFMITAGYNRVLSKAETFGRLYSCGFEISDEKMIDNRQFFVARKVREPFYDTNPTYGPLIKLRRYGKNGKKIGVYKMRTMHAYSEYLQEYVYNLNNLAEGGKFKDDFRVTTLGKIMRKFWIDELPMFINLAKGDMKLVGVRPLSRHYYGLLCEELQEKRKKHKPGLIPPFYVDLPKTMDEIQNSELKYLEAHEKAPLRTDWLYFWKAMYNIFVKNARSA